jgi:signal transduction histidine kinase
MFNKTLYEGINELLLSLPRNKIKFNLKETNKNNLRISDNKRIIVLRIIQELIHNMMKYANATESNIYIKKTINRFSLMVSDNGIGFDVKNIQKGNGLINLENKLKIIDGDHIIKSRIDKGTIFYITFPI